MQEEKKLAEATYFHAQMSNEQANMDRDAFRHNLSAFLAAARSVLQYADKEAKTKTGGRDWYQSWITSSPVLAFFRDKRNADIHEEPVKTVAQHDVSFTASASFSGSLDFVVRDKGGNIKQQGSSPPTPLPESLAAYGGTHTVRYRFDDWKGSEDVLTLCQQCLQELRKVINDGIAKGFITG